MQFIQQTLDRDPKNRSALQFLALCLFEEGAPVEALETWDKIIEFYPQDDKLRLKRAALLTDLANYTHAMQDLHLVLVKHPECIKDSKREPIHSCIGKIKAIEPLVQLL